MNRAGQLTGIPTGFKSFDEMTGGLQEGELMILNELDPDRIYLG